MRLVVFLLCMSFLGAYSPQYNWREVHQVGGGYHAAFPAKPQQMQREVSFDGLTLPMTMQVARVGEVSFAIAWVALQDDGQTMHHQTLSALRTALVNNIQGQELHQRPVAIRRASSAVMSAQEIQATGQLQATTMLLTARFVSLGSRVYQIVVLGPAETLHTSAGQQAIETFFTSVRLD